MTRYVAFLRAINVGGHVVKMDALRTLFESMKLASVETFIASGNVIFETNRRDTAALRATIESTLARALGYEVTTFLRTDAELAQVATYKPFPDAAVAAAATFCVGFLAAPLDAESTRKAMALKTAIDDFHVHGTEFYWLGGLKQSETKFSASVLEKAVKIRTTFRNVNTVQKLAARFPPR